MKSHDGSIISRRDLLHRSLPACAMATLGFCKLPTGLCSVLEARQQERHKFDVPQNMSMSTRALTNMQFSNLISFIGTLQSELPETEVIRLLNLYSAEVGRQQGARQAQFSTNTEFKTFVRVFRPPAYAPVLTHEIVEDTEKVFSLRVTECIWSEVFRAAGMGGDVGHAAVCNMDYYWPPAFNPKFKMERTKTLMQGHDCCNHRYVDTS